jgi:CRP-like cAMP-binding protein
MRHCAWLAVLFGLMKAPMPSALAQTSNLPAPQLTYMTTRGLGAVGNEMDRLLQRHGFSKILGPGNIIGEIGVFARDQKRMATVQCISDCVVLELSEAKAKEIYYQNPVFAYAGLQVVISRLMEDIALSKTEARNTIPQGQSVG